MPTQAMRHKHDTINVQALEVLWFGMTAHMLTLYLWTGQWLVALGPILPGRLFQRVALKLGQLTNTVCPDNPLVTLRYHDESNKLPVSWLKDANLSHSLRRRLET